MMLVAGHARLRRGADFNRAFDDFVYLLNKYVPEGLDAGLR